MNFPTKNNLFLFLLFFTFLNQNVFSQNEVDFIGSLPIKTGFNYNLNQTYPSPTIKPPEPPLTDNYDYSLDQYWKIINPDGVFETPLVKNLVWSRYLGEIGAWYTDNSLNHKWISTENTSNNDYVYRILFCVNNQNASEFLFEGQYAVDNFIKSIKIDGKTVIDFNRIDCINTAQGRGFECIRSFSTIIPPDTLTIGFHTLDIIVDNLGAYTGLLFNANISGINATILPASNSNNVGFCQPKGEITGVVFFDENNNSIKEISENLLSGYSVVLFNEFDIPIKTSVTNSSGAYVFNDLDMSKDYKVKLGAFYGSQTYPVSPIYWLVNSFPNTNVVIDKDFGIYYDTEVTPPCDECISSFSPYVGKKYLVSAWVKEEYTDKYPDTYIHSGIQLTFYNGTTPLIPLPALMRPSGPIIDGWQRIEVEMIIPVGTSSMDIELYNDGQVANVYFDDIRIHPFQSNMKSFVYNPSTQKLVAELDENNYSTQYEYDDEGILIRVKKETERGVMTIKESRNNQSKLNVKE